MQRKPAELVEHWGYNAANSLPGKKEISAGFLDPKYAKKGPEVTLQSHPNTSIWFTDENRKPIARVTYAPEKLSHEGRFVIQVNQDGSLKFSSLIKGRKKRSIFGFYNEVNAPNHVEHFGQLADLLKLVHAAVVEHAPKPKRRK